MVLKENVQKNGISLLEESVHFQLFWNILRNYLILRGAVAANPLNPYGMTTDLVTNGMWTVGRLLWWLIDLSPVYSVLYDYIHEYQLWHSAQYPLDFFPHGCHFQFLLTLTSQWYFFKSLYETAYCHGPSVKGMKNGSLTIITHCFVPVAAPWSAVLWIQLPGGDSKLRKSLRGACRAGSEAWGSRGKIEHTWPAVCTDPQLKKTTI